MSIWCCRFDLKNSDKTNTKLIPWLYIDSHIQRKRGYRQKRRSKFSGKNRIRRNVPPIAMGLLPSRDFSYSWMCHLDVGTNCWTNLSYQKHSNQETITSIFSQRLFVWGITQHPWTVRTPGKIFEGRAIIDVDEFLSNNIFEAQNDERFFGAACTAIGKKTLDFCWDCYCEPWEVPGKHFVPLGNLFSVSSFAFLQELFLTVQPQCEEITCDATAEEGQNQSMVSSFIEGSVCGGDRRQHTGVLKSSLFLGRKSLFFSMCWQVKVTALSDLLLITEGMWRTVEATVKDIIRAM